MHIIIMYTCIILFRCIHSMSSLCAYVLHLGSLYSEEPRMVINQHARTITVVAKLSFTLLPLVTSSCFSQLFLSSKRWLFETCDSHLYCMYIQFFTYRYVYNYIYIYIHRRGGKREIETLYIYIYMAFLYALGIVARPTLVSLATSQVVNRV